MLNFGNFSYGGWLPVLTFSRG